MSLPKPIASATEFFTHHARRIQEISVSGCWIWMGSHLVTGYGEVTMVSGKALAHRIAYEAANGPIPEGMVVRHRCHVPECVNPSHLIVGTQADNMGDMTAAGRQSRGEHRPKSKMTADLVRDLRAKAAAGVTIYRLAKTYGLCWSVAWRIVHRKSWSHVQ